MPSLSTVARWLGAIVLAYPALAETEKVPKLDVAQSCREAQAIAGEDNNLTYKGCMQDETEARRQLEKKWAKFKADDRKNCLAQALPLPSYVEVLTCVEMYDQASALYHPADRFGPMPPAPGPVTLPSGDKGEKGGSR